MRRRRCRTVFIGALLLLANSCAQAPEDQNYTRHVESYGSVTELRTADGHTVLPRSHFNARRVDVEDMGDATRTTQYDWSPQFEGQEGYVAMKGTVNAQQDIVARDGTVRAHGKGQAFFEGGFHDMRDFNAPYDTTVHQTENTVAEQQPSPQNPANEW